MNKTIEEKAKDFAGKTFDSIVKYNSYIQGSIDQQEIDIEKACEWMALNIIDYFKDDYMPKEFIEQFRIAMKK